METGPLKSEAQGLDLSVDIVRSALFFFLSYSIRLDLLINMLSFFHTVVFAIPEEAVLDAFVTVSLV